MNCCHNTEGNEETGEETKKDCCNGGGHEEHTPEVKVGTDTIATSSLAETGTVARVINPWQVATIVLSTVLIVVLAMGTLWGFGMVSFSMGSHNMNVTSETGGPLENNDTVYESIVPESVTLPINWKDIGSKMLSTGVIDAEKLTKLYESRGGMSDMMKSMLYSNDMTDVVMNKDNAGDLLNIFWAFGVSNKNTILDSGEMVDKKYGGDPTRFAATGGWTLATGPIATHYSTHGFVSLTTEQQAMVDQVSSGIYRPCCNNSTHFPDCNHGMAMLGLLELLAAQGMSENDMYDTALVVNSYWFSDTYNTIAQFFVQGGIAWDDVPAKDILGAQLSSGSGFAKVKASLTAPATASQSGGGGCGV